MSDRFELRSGYSSYDVDVIYDKLTKIAYPCDGSYDDVVRLLNGCWKQTLRFEKYMEEYKHELYGGE